MKIQGKECPKIRKNPPCIVELRNDTTIRNSNHAVGDENSILCSAFNDVFTEKNLRNILDIMKFSHASPLPQPLENMADYEWKELQNEYQVLFPNEGNINSLQKDGSGQI